MRQILDKDVNDGGLANEGWHLVEVRQSREKRSNNGDDYYSVELVGAPSGKHVAWDNIMLGGKGAGIGLRKLKVLDGAQRNATDTGWDIHPPRRLVGTRAFVHVFHKAFEWNGEQRTNCAVSIREGEAGYRAPDDPPEGFTADPPEGFTADDDIPF